MSVNIRGKNQSRNYLVSKETIDYGIKRLSFVEREKEKSELKSFYRELKTSKKWLKYNKSNIYTQKIKLCQESNLKKKNKQTLSLSNY